MKQPKLSDIVEMAQHVWASSNLIEALIIIEKFFLDHPGIKSKEDIIQQSYKCRTKEQLDRYIVNSILQFEGMSTNQ